MKQIVILFAALFCAVNAKASDEGLVKLNKGKLEFAMPDSRDFSYSLGGFIIFDYQNYFPDKGHVEMTPGAAGRALRVDLSGTLYEKWSFKGQYDFLGDAVRVRHAWLQYNWSEDSSLRIGQQNLPYGLESTASIRDQVLVERAMFHRAWGIRFLKAVSWNYRLGPVYSSLGLFGEDEAKNSNPNSSYAYNWRLVWQPVLTSDSSIHLGFVANRTSYRNSAEARFRVNPAGVAMTGTTQFSLIDTGVIAKRDYLFKGGPEFLLAYKNWALMSEYNEARLKRTGGLQSLRFSGYYANLIWIMTGEKFPYNAKTTITEGVKPSLNFGAGDGIGAWGLALRYDRLDLTDKDVIGGEETDMSLALLWWPNPAVKFVAQYSVGETKKGTISDDPSVIQLRAQVNF